jgi:hypothetical protein
LAIAGGGPHAALQKARARSAILPNVGVLAAVVPSEECRLRNSKSSSCRGCPKIRRQSGSDCLRSSTRVVSRDNGSIGSRRSLLNPPQIALPGPSRTSSRRPAALGRQGSRLISVIVKKFCHQNIYFLSLPTLLSVCLTYQWPHCESNPSIRTCVRRYTIREKQFRLSKYNTNHSVGVDQIYGQRTRIRL